MAFLDHNGESEFPMPKNIVFDAMCHAIPTIKGMKIETADRLQGRILVKGELSLFSWGENVPIQLLELSETKTRVQITSTPKTGIVGGGFDMGKNRKNIEDILSATSRVLSSSQPISPYTPEPNLQYSAVQNSAKIESKWYDRTWIAIFLCVFFFPVGLYALWKNKHLAQGWKIGITAFIALALIGNASDKTKKGNQAISATKTVESTTEAPKVAYNKIGDVIPVENYIYRVDGIQFKKTLGNEFIKETADGVFLLVPLSIKNISKESRTLDNSMFKLTDEQGTEYESSTRGTTAVEMSGEKTLFLKQCQPNIQTAGLLVFEVPAKGIFNLKLSGGFWSGKTASVKLTN
jgi:Domain of unknown function (DUF4352)